jgi:hypothetical protein
MWENDDLPELDFGTAVNPPNKFLKRDGLMVCLGAQGREPTINKPK